MHLAWISENKTGLDDSYVVRLTGSAELEGFIIAHFDDDVNSDGQHDFPCEEQEPRWAVDAPGMSATSMCVERHMMEGGRIGSSEGMCDSEGGTEST